MASFSNQEKALSYLKEHGVPLVIKITSPTFGRGSFIAVEEGQVSQARELISTMSARNDAVILFEDYPISQKDA